MSYLIAGDINVDFAARRKGAGCRQIPTEQLAQRPVCKENRVSVFVLIFFLPTRSFSACVRLIFSVLWPNVLPSTTIRGFEGLIFLSFFCCLIFV